VKREGEHRRYDPGEDLQKARDGTVVCQGAGLVRGYRGRQGICGKPVTKLGRFRLAGGWHDVYACPYGHRFGLKGTITEARGGHLAAGQPQRLSEVGVIDVTTGKPTFGGGELPF